MQTIKFLKPDLNTGKQKIKLNGITYKPYTVCDLPANFDTFEEALERANTMLDSEIHEGYELIIN